MNVTDKTIKDKIYSCLRKDNKHGLASLIPEIENIDEPLFFPDRSILHAATSMRAKECARLILEHGANPNTFDKFGYTPLLRCAEDNLIATANDLIAHGAHVDLEHEEAGTTPLIEAALNGFPKIVALLLSAGANPLAKCNEGYTVLHHCRCVKCADILVNAGADVHYKDSEGVSPIHAQSFNRQTLMLEFLVNKGVDVNIPTLFGDTPLHYAALASDSETVDFLISKGANPNQTSHSGDTPLHVAASEFDYELAIGLLRSGADLDIKNDNGETPLNIAEQAENDMFIRAAHEFESKRQSALLKRSVGDRGSSPESSPGI